MRLRVGHQLVVLTDFGPFHGLLLTVLGPGVISTINEPWCGFMFWSSTLAVLADSDPFHGLLLTIFGPQTNFHSC